MAANANRVKKNVKRELDKSETGYITRETADDLKAAVDADDMKTSCFQQLLTTMKHGGGIRGFSLTIGNAYIKA